MKIVGAIGHENFTDRPQRPPTNPRSEVLAGLWALEWALC